MAAGVPAIKPAARFEGGIAVAAVGIVMMLVMPLPHWMLDLLLTLNITLALSILVLTFYVRKPLEFSSFPSLLLLITLFRLSLNVSATRLILGEGDAGAVIAAFGNFVISGNFVVGIVVFIILVIIQFVVITSGAGRVAEVAARFTLDAMPGKQMAIDAELNAGAIDEETARARRQEIAREADFYGAMDGSSKFIRGDAIAAVVMMLVNVVGGLAIGMLQHGMEIGTAVQTYTILTVGEGLVTQVPALLISAASGLIVTRTAGETSLSTDVGAQLSGYPQAMFIASGVLGLMGLVPGFPKIPFFALAAGLAWYGAQTRKKLDTPPPPPPPAPKPPENMADLLVVDPMEVELGYGLVCLADARQGGDLLDRVTAVRRQIALEMGFLVPPIRVRDNVRLRGNQYVIRLRALEIGGGEVYPNQLLAMDSGVVTQTLPGTETRDPAFGLPAVWVPGAQRTLAEISGYAVVEPTSVMVTHLAELLRRHAPEILNRQDVQELLNTVKQQAPAVVDELIPGLLTLGQVQKVLQLLLKERVSIRDLVTILEAMADGASVTRDPEALSEMVRQKLARQLTKQHLSPNGSLYCFTIHPTVEQAIVDNLRRTEAGTMLVMDASTQARLLGAVRKQAERMIGAGRQPLALCAPRIRSAFRQLAEQAVPTLAALSYSEVTSGVAVEALGMVTWNDEDQAI